MECIPVSQPQVLPLLLAALVFFTYRLYATRDSDGQPMVVPLLLGTLLLMAAALGGTLPNPWLHAGALLGLHLGLGVTVIGIERVLTGRVKGALLRRKLLVGVFIASLFVVLVDSERTHLAQRGEQPVLTVMSPLDLTSYTLNYSLQLILLVMILWHYATSLGRQQNMVYVVRRVLCMVGYTLAIICVFSTKVTQLVSPTGAQEVWLLNSCQRNLMVSLGILVVAFTTPHRVLARGMWPLAALLAWRRRRHDQALQELHHLLIQIAPGVHLRSARLRPVRILIEISDARQLIWSHVDRRAPITPRDEARYIADLIRRQTIVTDAGPYTPPALHHGSVIRHNHATLKHLRCRLNTQKRSSRERPSIGLPI